MKPPTPQSTSKSSGHSSIIKSSAADLDKEFKSYEKILWKVLVYCLNDPPKKKSSGNKSKNKAISEAKARKDTEWIIDEEEMVQSDEESEEEEPMNQMSKSESSADELKDSMGTNEEYEDDSLIDYAHISIL